MRTNSLNEFARMKLKEGLAKCTDDEQYLFKRMYAPSHLDKDIDWAVDNMDDTKLDFACFQVENTLAKKESLNV